MKTRSFLIAAMFTMAAIGLVSAIRPGITIVKETGQIDGAPPTIENQTPATTTTLANAAEPQLIGGQTDSHGCLGPAGFSWNETAGKCMRPWNGEIQLAGGTAMVDISDPNWREKLTAPILISTDIKCVDTDNGKDYYTKGKVYVYGMNPKMDSCVRHRFLREWSCSGDTSVSSFVVCKKGCKDGACLPELSKTQLIGPPVPRLNGTLDEIAIPTIDNTLA